MNLRYRRAMAARARLPLLSFAASSKDARRIIFFLFHFNFDL
ncbi:hypothetical protein [Burkholderia pseudomultivorans]|nr:hypothetical protein [Burkholderia pseudomultivorans]